MIATLGRTVDAGRWDVAQHALLELWREAPHPELVPRMERLDALAPIGRRPETGDALLAGLQQDLASTDPFAVPRALRQLPQLDRPGVEALLITARAQPADPRWGALVGWIDAPPYTSGTSMWAAVFDVLARCRDARIRPRLEAGHRGLDFMFAGRISASWGRCLEAVRAWPPPPSGDLDLAPLDAALDRAGVVGRERQRTVDGLIDRVAANPSDEASWSVLADLLTQEGDARGEHIALAQAGEDGAAQALAEPHEALWLDDLAPFAQKTGRAWSRGFPTRLTVTFTRRAQAEAVASSRVWRSVRDLDLRGRSWPRDEAFPWDLLVPALPNLQVARGVVGFPALWALLRDGPSSLRELRGVDAELPSRWDASTGWTLDPLPDDPIPRALDRVELSERSVDAVLHAVGRGLRIGSAVVRVHPRTAPGDIVARLREGGLADVRVRT